MLLVGELLNTSRRAVERAVLARDEKFVRAQAGAQSDAGADMIDVNAGMMADEPEALAWLVQQVEDETGLPVMIDSPNAVAVRSALAVCRNKAVVNSITGERDRLSQFLPIVTEHRCGVVALAVDDEGVPRTSAQASAAAGRLVSRLMDGGIAPADILIDPVVRPISVDTAAAVSVIEMIAAVRTAFPGTRTICGLSNISYGLPRRRLLNQAFAAALVVAGLDAAICDPLDAGLMAMLHSARAIAGQDPYCSGYIRAYRAGRLDGRGVDGS